MIQQKPDFNRIQKAYLILTVQILITALVVMYFRTHDTVRKRLNKYILGVVILSFVLIFAIHYAKTPLAKFALFSLFSVCIGSFCLASSSKVKDTLVASSLKATAGLYFTMTLVGLVCYKYGIDLSRLQFVLFFGLIGLILAMLFAPRTAHRTVFTIGIVIFALYLSYDTWNLVSNTGSDPTSDALSLYLSLINTFQQVLGLKLSE